MSNHHKRMLFVLQIAGEELIVELFIPPGCIVGSYRLAIEFNEQLIYELPQNIVILFNPWCERKFSSIFNNNK